MYHCRKVMVKNSLIQPRGLPLVIAGLFYFQTAGAGPLGTAANCDERCRCQPKGISPRIPQRGLRKRCWLRLWIVLRLWMSGVFQLLVTLRNKLLCTLRHLRQQLRHSLRASEIRLRRTVRTDFLLRVPAAPLILASSCGYHLAMSRVLPTGRFFSQPSILARATAIALCRDPSKG